MGQPIDPVEWPLRRADVLSALDALAEDPPALSSDGQDPRWPDLTNAVHWLVDDTWWDHYDPRDSIGQILRNEQEAVAVEAVVAIICEVAAHHGPGAADADWFSDLVWPRAQAAAGHAARMLHANDEAYEAGRSRSDDSRT